MLSPIRIRRLDSGVSPDRGLLDTSVVIGIDEIDRKRLPIEIAISALTLAELTSGPHATGDGHERGLRQELLQRVEAGIETLPFDSECARAFGRICAATVEAGRRIGGSRMVDLMIAGVALSHRMPLYTLDASDLKGLEGLIEVVDLG
jgi:predicted nucleic acid-binding protein